MSRQWKDSISFSNLNGDEDQDDCEKAGVGGSDSQSGKSSVNVKQEARPIASESSALAEQDADERWREKLYIIYVTIIGAIGGLLFGYDTVRISLTQICSNFVNANF